MTTDSTAPKAQDAPKTAIETAPEGCNLRFLQLEEALVSAANGRLAAIDEPMYPLHRERGFYCKLPRDFIYAFVPRCCDPPQMDASRFSYERYFDTWYHPEGIAATAGMIEYEIYVNSELVYRGSRQALKTMLPYVRVFPANLWCIYEMSVHVKTNPWLQSLFDEGNLTMQVLCLDPYGKSDPYHLRKALHSAAALKRVDEIMRDMSAPMSVVDIPWGLTWGDMPNFMRVEAGPPSSCGRIGLKHRVPFRTLALEEAPCLDAKCGCHAIYDGAAPVATEPAAAPAAQSEQGANKK